MVLWSVEVIHFTKFLPLDAGATPGCSEPGAGEVVGRSAYVVMPHSPSMFQDIADNQIVRPL